MIKRKGMNQSRKRSQKIIIKRKGMNQRRRNEKPEGKTKKKRLKRMKVELEV